MANTQFITRRLFMRNAAAVSMVSATGVASPVTNAAASSSVEMTAAERMVHHLAEFQRAAQEADPSIGGWDVRIGAEPFSSTNDVIKITASRSVTSFYKGDGEYKILYHDPAKPFLPASVRTATIERAADRDREGERFFSVRIERRDGTGYRFWTDEHWLDTKFAETASALNS